MSPLRGAVVLVSGLVVVVALIVGVIWAAGGMMTRSCDQVERRAVHLARENVTVMAEVCVGEWR